MENLTNLHRRKRVKQLIHTETPGPHNFTGDFYQTLRNQKLEIDSLSATECFDSIYTWKKMYIRKENF